MSRYTITQGPDGQLLYYKADTDKPINRIKVRGEDVFEFDLKDNWRILELCWNQDSDRIYLTIAKEDDDDGM